MKRKIKVFEKITRVAVILWGVMLSSTLWAYAPLLDDQPVPDEQCPISNTSHTENAEGSAIDVRHYECSVGERNVVWTLSIPPSCEDGGCGLIVDIHGATMSAAQQNAGTKLREFAWQAVNYGASTAYIVAQPNLTDLFDAEIGLDFSSVGGGAYENEVPALNLFINDMMESFDIDLDRTHMYGFSRGAATTSVFYCGDEFQGMFASFAVGGGGINCALGHPLLILNGSFDPGKMALNDGLVEEIQSKGIDTEVLVSSDGSWSQIGSELVWQGFVPTWRTKGGHRHMRYISGDYVLESIKHSGFTQPLAGHCHPVRDYNGWLNCYNAFDTGEKLIKFFINNPR